MKLRIKAHEPGRRMVLRVPVPWTTWGCTALVTAGWAAMLVAQLAPPIEWKVVAAWIALPGLAVAGLISYCFFLDWRVLLDAEAGVHVGHGPRRWTIPRAAIQDAWLTFEERHARGTGPTFHTELCLAVDLPDHAGHQIEEGVAVVLRWIEDDWEPAQAALWERLDNELEALGWKQPAASADGAGGPAALAAPAPLVAVGEAEAIPILARHLDLLDAPEAMLPARLFDPRREDRDPRALFVPWTEPVDGADWILWPILVSVVTGLLALVPIGQIRALWLRDNLDWLGSSEGLLFLFFMGGLLAGLLYFATACWWDWLRGRRLAARARAEIAARDWPYGLFLRDDALLLRTDGECFYFPKARVLGCDLFVTTGPTHVAYPRIQFVKPSGHAGAFIVYTDFALPPNRVAALINGWVREPEKLRAMAEAFRGGAIQAELPYLERFEAYAAPLDPSATTAAEPDAENAATVGKEGEADSFRRQ